MNGDQKAATLISGKRAKFERVVSPLGHGSCSFNEFQEVLDVDRVPRRYVLQRLPDQRIGDDQSSNSPATVFMGRNRRRGCS